VDALEGDEDGGRIEAALLRGAEDRGEPLLGLRAAAGAIAAAAHRAGDHRGPPGMFGASSWRAAGGRPVAQPDGADGPASS